MSILGLGESYKNNATSGFRDLAQLEENRNMQNEASMSSWELAKYQNKAAKKASTMSSTATGAGIGFMAGGPVGAAIGAAAGYLFGSLF